MSLTMDEQETTVTVIRSENVTHVYSSDPKHIRKILADDRFTVIEHTDDSIKATISSKDFDPITGLKRRVNFSPEQKAERAERLRAARSAS